MTDSAGPGPIERARDAKTGGNWQEAFDLLMEADADGLLAPGDLPVLGEVAYVAYHLDVTIEAWSVPTRRTCRRMTGSRPQLQPFASRCTCSSTRR